MKTCRVACLTFGLMFALILQNIAVSSENEKMGIPSELILETAKNGKNSVRNSRKYRDRYEKRGITESINDVLTDMVVSNKKQGSCKVTCKPSSRFISNK